MLNLLLLVIYYLSYLSESEWCTHGKDIFDGLKANFAQDLLLESSCGWPRLKTLRALLHDEWHPHCTKKFFFLSLRQISRISKTTYNFSISLIPHYSFNHLSNKLFELNLSSSGSCPGIHFILVLYISLITYTVYFIQDDPPFTINFTIYCCYSFGSISLSWCHIFFCSSRIALEQ